MDRQLQLLVRLVDDLLDMSRITKGIAELRKQHVELRTIVQNAVETSRPLVESSDHILTVELPSEPIWLEADPIRMAQVICNLLNNSARYTAFSSLLKRWVFTLWARTLGYGDGRMLAVVRVQ